MFWKKQKQHQKAIYLKKQLKNLQEYDFEKISIPLEQLAYHNFPAEKQFESVALLFNNFATIFNQKLSFLEQNIQKIPLILNNYDWKNFNLVYTQTICEIALIEKSIKLLLQLKTNILNYRDYLSDIIISYRENSWDLIHFYETNLFQPNTTVKHLIKILKNNHEKLNQLYLQYDLAHIQKTIHNTNNNYGILWHKIAEIYTITKQNNYINYSINEIKNNIKKKHRFIKTNVINHAEKEITKIIKNWEYIQNNLQFEQTKAQKITVSIIHKLTKIQKELNLTYEVNDFFNKNKTQLNFIFNDLKTFMPKIYLWLKKTCDDFTNSTLASIITQLMHQNQTICANLSHYQKNSNQKKYNYQQLLQDSKMILQNSQTFLLELEKIIIKCKKKHEATQRIVNDLINHKIMLGKMKIYAQQKNQNQNLILIPQLLKEIDKLEVEFNNNPFAKISYISIKLNEIKRVIAHLNLNVSKKELLKVYNEKVIQDLIIKSALKNKEIDITKAIAFYYQKKHKESILALINQLQ